jgi:succinyl-diaminopimelate desuccinylase
VEDLKKLIAVKSVRGETKKDAPFGEGPKKVLEIALDIAKGMGFEVKNVDNYAGHVQFGENGKLYAVLGHLDVVPEGEGWETDPYELNIKDGFLVGRGVADNKGPSLGALYALRIVKELGIEPKNTVRVIFGTNEESGFGCMQYYFQKEPYPDVAIVPDATFPLIYAEKGIINYTFKLKLKTGNYHTRILEFKGGTASNVVPQVCEVKIETEKVSEIEYVLKNFKPQNGSNIEWKLSGNIFEIKTIGKPAHASTPQLGINAIGAMLEFLNYLDLEEDWKNAIGILYNKLGKDYRGEGLGISGRNGISGELTCNLGVLSFEDDCLKAVINIRYPIFYNSDMMTFQIKEAMKPFEVEVGKDSKPLYVPKESELVQMLLKVYREITGDYTSEPLTMGGGTYARAVPYGVAFGAGFPDDPDSHVHQANERIKLDSILKFIKIYAIVMYRFLES